MVPADTPDRGCADVRFAVDAPHGVCFHPAHSVNSVVPAGSLRFGIWQQMMEPRLARVALYPREMGGAPR